MFVILDTNHFSELIRSSAEGTRLRDRLIETGSDVFVSVITAHESLGGWLAFINRYPAGSRQVEGYLEFRQSLQALAELEPIDFDHAAAAKFVELKAAHPRMGSMDLKIAAICITHDAVRLTRNLKDFEGISSLRTENWLD